MCLNPLRHAGKSSTTAESKAGGGKLMLTRWRARKLDEVVLNLRVHGTYVATVTFERTGLSMLTWGLTRLHKILLAKLLDERTTIAPS